MKKLLLLIAVLMVVSSGCNSMDIFEDSLKNSTSKVETGIGRINPDSLNTGCEPLCRDEDTEENINAKEISDDITLTGQAEKLNITEYDVVVDGIDRGVLPTENSGGDSYKVLEVYDTRIPDDLEINLIYDRYNVAFDYAIVLSDNINLRSAPSVSSAIIGKAHSLEKLNLIAKVKGQYLDSYGSDIWYQIAWNDVDTLKEGYIFGTLVEIRYFKFNTMLEEVRKLKAETDSNITAYVANYKDRNGQAPPYQGKEKDSFGVSRYQSATGYHEASVDSGFRYIPDGMLVSLLDESDSFYKVRVPSFEGEYYIPRKYISPRSSIRELKQAVVVDRTNQNEAVFQYFDGKWQIVSYTYATTGGDSGYQKPTEKGCFMAIQKRDGFEFHDGTSDRTMGYAPYAVRFNGSSYIHGIPVECENEDGENSDLGLTEYLFTLGTFPHSNGSVRNYTSHAKFLYEWLVIGESAVIVID